MQEKYYIKIHIESVGTPYQGENGITKSLAGHMWFETYKKDENNNYSDILNSGYSRKGIKDNDGSAYLGDPAYSTREIELTKEQYVKLKKFGEVNSQLAQKFGFGNNDYNVLTNSCIDYTWKALELAGINKSKFEGDLVPMYNKDELQELLNNGQIAYLIDGFINLEYTNRIETENFYKLPENTQSLLTNEGKHPSGPKWNSFINEMLHYRLNNETQGITQLEDLSIEFTDKFETNKEEKTQTIKKEFKTIDSQITIEQRIQCLKEFDLKACFENNYVKQLLEQYQEKVIENLGKEVSALDFINMEIKQEPLALNIQEQKEEKRYLDFESINTNQNNNSQIQTMN